VDCLPKKKKTLSSVVLQPFYRNSRSIAVRQEDEREEQDDELDDELSTVTPFVFSHFWQSWWCFDLLYETLKDLIRPEYPKFL
jgi:hypothetical protein